MSRPVRSYLGLGAMVLMVSALFGHWYYWYAPRAHSGSPRSKDSTARILFGATDLPLRLWIPFPHQNLGALERTVGDLEGLSGISSYLVDQDLAALPSFGPFRLPPARDLVVAGSSDGDRLVVAASVYPLVGWLGRLAGRLAGNAWLAGGSVELHGRTVQVEWRDGMWSAAQGEIPRTVGQRVPELSPSHALLSLEQPLGSVPKGLYRLDVETRGWRVASAALDPVRPVDSQVRPPLPPGLALVAASTSSKEAVDSMARTFVLLSGADGASDQLTRAVVAQRGAGEPWRLPAEKLLSVLGYEVSRGNHDGWSLAAYDEAAIHELAGRLSSISALLESTDEAHLELGIWMDLAEARGALNGLVGALSALPLPPTEQIQRWTMAARALTSLDSTGSLSLTIGGSPPRLEMWVESPGSD